MAKAHTELVNKALLALQERFPRGHFWPVNTGQLLGLTSGGGLRPIKANIPGIGDIDGYIPICGVAVRFSGEAKVRKDRQRKSQEVFERELLAAGGIYVLFRTPEEAVEKTVYAVDGIPVRILGPGWERRYVQR